MPALRTAHAGGGRYVAVSLLEQPHQEAALEFGDRTAFGALVIKQAGARRSIGSDQFVRRGDRYFRAFREQKLAHDEIFELADIARPRVALEPGERRGIELP